MTGAFEFDPDRLIKRQDHSAEVLPLRNMPAGWQHGLHLLEERPLPRGVTASRWAQVVADARQLATRYQDAALAAGWDMANLFGYDPLLQFGPIGLAVAMRGRLLVNIDADHASLKTETGYEYHYPRMPANSPLLWTFSDRGGQR